MPAGAFWPTTTPTVRHLSVKIASKDVTPYVLMDSFELEDTAGDGAQGTFRCTLNRALSLLPELFPQAYVEVFDHDAGIDIFRGFLKTYRPVLDQGTTFRMTEIVAGDQGELMDRFLAGTIKRPIEGDRARLAYFWGRFHNARLNPHLTYVQSIDTAIPAVIYNGVTLRRVFDDIAAAAGTTVRWYIDQVGRLHYYATETNAAPKNITSDAPGAGEISVEDLEIDYDAGAYANNVYVQGGNAAGSGYVQDGAAIAKLGTTITAPDPIDAPHSKTSTARDKIGNAYLARVTGGITRGSFSTTSNKATGWLSGQTLTVRSSSIGITADTRIVKVRTTVLKNDVRHYDIEFGALKHIKAYRLATGSIGSGGSGGLNGIFALTGGSTIGTLTDDHSTIVIANSTSGDGTAGIGAATRRYLLAGIYNGDFSALPHSPDAAITDHNALPYWTAASASGTGVEITSIADTSSASGRLIRFALNSGAAGDDAYLEQLVPVNGSRGQSFTYVPAVAYLPATTAINAQLYISGQYFTSAGVSTGATTTATVTFAAAVSLQDLPVKPNAGVTPADAYYLRVRVGIKRNTAATTDIGSIDIPEVRVTAGVGPTYIADTAGGTPWTLTSGGTGLLQVQHGGTNYVSIDGTNDQIILIPGASAGKYTWLKRRLVGAADTADTIGGVGSTFSADGWIKQFTATGAFVLTSAPTISDGTNGQIITLLNVGANAVTVSDQGTLANSNLRLSTATYAIASRDSLTLVYDSTIGDWVEIGRTNVI